MFTIKNKQHVAISAGLLLVISADISVAQNLIKYDPSKTPILKIATPKPNIFLALDDSASMTDYKIYVPEHFYGPGDPACANRGSYLQTFLSKEWVEITKKYKEMGEKEGVKYYNPFGEDGRQSYTPYIISKDGSKGISEEEYNKYIDSIPIERCEKVYRTEAIIQMVPEILEKYSKRAYLGYGGLGKEPLSVYNFTSLGAHYEKILAKLRLYFLKHSDWNYDEAIKIADDDVKNDIKYNVFTQLITDMSAYTPTDWERIRFSVTRNIMGKYKDRQREKYLLGNTPTFNAIYYINLYFRGYPVAKEGHIFPYGTKKAPLPKRYRCTTNSVVVLTDGNSNDRTLGIVAKKDLAGHGGPLPKQNLSDGTEVPSDGTYHFTSDIPLHYLVDLGYLFGETWSTPPIYEALNKAIAREFTAASMKDGKYEDKDAAGKGWKSDKFGIPQKLQVNAVQYGGDIFNKFNKNLEDLTRVTGGQVITLETDVTASSVLNAMDTIMSDLIRSTSNAQVATSQFQQTGNSIRYTFKYSIESKRGEVIAHKADKNSDSGWAEFNDKGKPISLWRSETSISPATGRFITMDYTSTPKSALINLNSIKSSYSKGTDKNDLHNNHIGWLNGNTVIDDINLPSEHRVYKKLSPMGPIVNSEVALFEHDVEYINLKNLGGDVKKAFNQYVLYKNKMLNKDYMIINSNDGMVNFLSVPRSSPTIEEELIAGTKSVQRITAYFPGILSYRLPKLSGINAKGYSIDGVARLFEFKDSNGDFRSIGLSGFGAGGRGLVGYQLFKATPDPSTLEKFKDADSEIKPLFEISNESNWQTYGNNRNFENLGYTFSDFGFFNQAHPVNTGNGRGIAVFGNGYGENKSKNSPSSLYFIDAETGAFIKEVMLNDNGGGASSPALIVEKSGDYHTLKKIYVGDASGQLYRITFTADDLSHNPIEVLYKPLDAKYNPITVKPLVVLDKDDEWVYFGTGRKSDKSLDRGKSSPSKDTQYIVGLKNPKPINDEALTINELHQNKLTLSKEIEIDLYGQKKKIQTIGTTSVDSGPEKIKQGWYIALTKAINPKANTGGERVVFSPKQTYSDVIFSTWGIDEYETTDKDPCVEDYAYGKVLILDKKTGLLGTGKIKNEKVSGFVMDEHTPGMPSGYGIMEGRIAGEFSGRSTLDKETIDELNKAADSTHAAAEKKVCFGNVSDDSPNVYDFTVTCPPGKTLSGRRISIRKRL